MLRARPSSVSRGAIALALILLWASPAAADGQTIGGACTTGADSAANSLGGNNAWCNGSTWQYPAYQFGASAATCNSTNAGIAQWTGSSVTPNNTFEFCNGTSWIAVTGAASASLSSITAATGSASINSGANAITWAWNSLGGGTTGMTFSTSSALTGGSALFSLQATAASATSTGYVLSLSNATTGTGYVVYSAMTATANTGYAGYFSNASGSGYALYAVESTTTGNCCNNGLGAAIYGVQSSSASVAAGIYGTSASVNGYGVAGLNSSTTGGPAYGVFGGSNANNGVGVFGSAVAGVVGNSSCAGGCYGVEGADSSTGAGIGVYGVESGAGNTGYGGYFTNSGNGWALGATGTSYFNGNVGIGTASPTGNLQIGTLTLSGTATPVTIDLGGTYSSTNGAHPKLILWDDGGGASTISGLGVGSGEIDYIVPSGNQHAFWVGSTQALTITSTGSVGIGTTSPVAPLTVQSTSAQMQLNYDATHNVPFSVSSGGNLTITPTGGGMTFNGGTSNQVVTVSNTYNGLDEIMLLQNGQAAAAGVGSEIDFTGTAGSNVQAGIGGAWNGAANTDAYMAFKTRTAGSATEYMRLTSTGSLGIGTTGPATKLDVNGDMTDENVKSCAMLGTDSNGKLVCKTPAMVLIATLTASASASLQFSGSNWSSSYNTLFLNCAGILLSVGGGFLETVIGEGAGPTWETGAHYTRFNWWDAQNQSGIQRAAPVTNATFMAEQSGSTTIPQSMKLYLDNPGSSSLYKLATINAVGYDDAGGIAFNPALTWSYWNNDTNAVTGIELFPSSGNIASGTCSLYGMN